MSRELLKSIQDACEIRSKAAKDLELLAAKEDIANNMERLHYYARCIVNTGKENNIEVELTDLLSQQFIDKVPYDEDSDGWYN